MKKIVFIMLLLGFLGTSWAQEDFKKLAKDDLSKLSEAFKLKETEFTKQDSIFKSQTAKVNINTNDNDIDNLKEHKDKARTLHLQLDSIFDKAENYITYYKSKCIDKKDQEEIESYFIHKHIKIDAITDKEPETKTYFYFGENTVIEENDSLFNNKTANLIFKDILEAKSETYLGDFSIPKKGQKIEFENVTRKKEGWFNDRNYEMNESCLYFKSIKIHLFEGSLCDIKLIVTDYNNDEYLFENKVPSSLLKFSRLNHKRYLYCKPVKINGNANTDTENPLLYYRIKSSDVLNYVANPGNNYVPENETFDFPLIENDKETNANNPAKYKIISDSTLQNIVELRTYTDFLGLFGDAPNGIVQIEGKADFYVSPFNIPHTNAYVFKKVTPFVHFSKIEKDVRNLNLTAIDNATSTIKTPLEIIEKSYLKMGLNLNIFNFKFTKEFPFDINLYGAAMYQISDLIDKTNIQVNYKSLGLGGGMALEFKRFNNFGFIYSAELTKYNTNSFNKIEGIVNPNCFMVFKNEAEVYYFPNESKLQSIFLRLKTFNDATKDINDAFYQLQFGYRFAIGAGKIKQ